MATSGSDETELDSESVIDPDSLNHCSDMPPVTKKRRMSVSKKVSVCKFKRSWSLPQHITFSSKGDSFAYCRLCSSHFSVSHGGFNNVKRHVSGSVHQQRQKDSCGTSGIATFFQKDASDHQRNVLSAEVQMSNFIAMHNLSFQTADHLSDLLPKMFPDSKIASDLSCILDGSTEDEIAYGGTKVCQSGYFGLGASSHPSLECRQRKSIQSSPESENRF